MFVKVGQYPHPINECNLRRMEIKHRLSPRGKRVTKIITLYLEGYLYADTQSGLTAVISQLIEAYREDYQEIGLYEDDGAGNIGVRTPHYIDNVGSVSGVRILGRNWPKGAGDEYANKRFFSITAYSEYADAETQLVYWKDSVKVVGTGGPRREVRETWEGPYEYLTAKKTSQRLVRTGQAIGFTAYIKPPGPVDGANEDVWLREIELDSGDNQGLLPCFKTTRWAYYHTLLQAVSAPEPWNR